MKRGISRWNAMAADHLISHKYVRIHGIRGEPMLDDNIFEPEYNEYEVCAWCGSGHHKDDDYCPIRDGGRRVPWILDSIRMALGLLAP